MKKLHTHYFKVLCLLLLIPGISFRGKACSPLNTPAALNFSLSPTNSLVITVSNTSSWLNCPNVIDIEFACSTSNFSGLASDTYTSAPQSFASSPYTYAVQYIDISNLCPGTVYKIRIRERNNNSTTSSSWSSISTFTTSGSPITPILSLSASPNLICPPQNVQLQASITNTCGRSNLTYAWLPTTGLNNANIPNPIASITTPTTYTCIVTGGATGCWVVVGSIFLNVGTGPPVPGAAVVTPSVLCVFNSATLSTSNFTGTVQWQSSNSSLGPFANIPGANTPTFVVPSVSATTCFQAIFTSCSGATLASNIACAVTNTIPTLIPSTSCSGTVQQTSFSYIGTSGSPTAVVWSPLPISINSNSTVANYTTSGTVYGLAFFGDGCISSTSMAVNMPTLSVSSSSVSCNTLGSGTMQLIGGTGPITYSWMPTSQTTSIATGLFPGTYTTSAGYGTNCAVTTTITLNSLSQITGTVNNSPSISCPNVNTGTAAISLQGGTGLTSYTWATTNTSLFTPTVSGLPSGIHTVTVMDQITYCVLSKTFQINTVPNLSLNITASSPTACINSTIGLTALMGGGTPGYTYSWTAGPVASVYNVLETNSGQHTYTVTAGDVNNCTISQTVGVTFMSLPSVSVTNTSICPGKTGTLTASGATSYTWLNNPLLTGATFTANPNSPTFYLVTGSSQGCSSSISGLIQMLPIPAPNITHNSPVCSGQSLSFSGHGGLSYQWSGPGNFQSASQNAGFGTATPTMSGIYNLTVTAVNTCSAATSASLTVHALPPVIAVGSTVCSTGVMNLSVNSNPGSTFLWVGPNFTSANQNPSVNFPSVANSGNYSIKVTSIEGCTNTAIVNVTVTQQPIPNSTSNSPKCTGDNAQFNATGGISYAWGGPNGFSSNLQSPSIPNVPMGGNGVYTVYVTTGPCVATSTLNYTVFALPTVTASTGGAVCETKTLGLISQTGGPVSSYLWTGPFYTSTLSNPQRPTVSMLDNGDYTLTVTDGNGCKATAITTGTILQNPNVSATGATVCLYSTGVLNVHGASSYIWSGPDMFQSALPSPTIISVKNINVGTYTVSGKAVNNCVTTVTAQVLTMPLPNPSLTVQPSNTICLNGSVKLTGSGGVSYKWYGPENIYVEGQIANLNAQTMAFAGIYTLVATDKEGCSNSITTRMQIHDLPEGALISGPTAGCAPLCGLYSFAPLNKTSKIRATWEVQNINYPQTFSVCLNEPGSYTVTGYFYDSLTTCSNFKKFPLVVYPVPEAIFKVNPEKPIENLDEAIFTNLSTGTNLTKFTWHFAPRSPSDLPTVIESEHIRYVFEDAGKYTVAMMAENDFGCTDTMIKLIEVAPDFSIYVPNAFTPNGDRNNEDFKAVVRGVKLFDMTVYNRWGVLVWQGTDPNIGWDGSFNGQPAKSDVYTWKIKATSIHGESREMQGHVTLYR